MKASSCDKSTTVGERKCRATKQKPLKCQDAGSGLSARTPLVRRRGSVHDVRGAEGLKLARERLKLYKFVFLFSILLWRTPSHQLQADRFSAAAAGCSDCGEVTFAPSGKSVEGIHNLAPSFLGGWREALLAVLPLSSPKCVVLSPLRSKL